MTIFTKTAVIKAMEEIVAELGEDYVYPRAVEYKSCVYAEDGEPSCFVGRVIAKLDPEKFQEIAEIEKKIGGSWSADDFSGEYSVGYDEAKEVNIYLKLDATKAGLVAMYAGQRKQDRRETYGVALKAAKESRA